MDEEISKRQNISSTKIIMTISDLKVLKEADKLELKFAAKGESEEDVSAGGE